MEHQIPQVWNIPNAEHHTLDDDAIVQEFQRRPKIKGLGERLWNQHTLRGQCQLPSFMHGMLVSHIDVFVIEGRKMYPSHQPKPYQLGGPSTKEHVPPGKAMHGE